MARTVKMNKAGRAIRDEQIIKRYQAGVTPTALADSYNVGEAAIFAILKRHKVMTATVRGRTGTDTFKYRDAAANSLVATGFCRCPEKATEYLRRADYFQQNPHQFKLSELGITPQKLAACNHLLTNIHAHVTGGIPFYVYFSTRNAFLMLTFRELIFLVANPYMFLFTNKDRVIDVPGEVVGNGGKPVAVSIKGLEGL